MNVEEVVERFERVRRSGTGWSARCPAHEDRQNSLSISEGSDGRVLIHCFAGCRPESIVSPVGLTMRDLFPSGHHRAARIPLRSVRRAEFKGTALHVVNVLYAMEQLGMPWQLMLTSDCPACGSQGAWLRANSDSQPDADCWEGCDAHRYVQALLARLNNQETTT